jgi:phosphatidylinositol alpha-1,6-mannosyltransferase
MMLLVLTRKYPPAAGGMEKMSYELTRHLSNKVELKLIKFTKKSDNWLPLVYVLFFVRTFFVMLSVRVDAIYLTDALLAPLGIILKRVYGAKIFVIVHGLDITFDNAIFQRVVPAAVSRMDKVICVSSATQRECTQRGVAAAKTVVIPNGTCDSALAIPKSECRDLLRQKVGIDAPRAFLVLSVGRLVERKGFHWFTDKVLPELIRVQPNARYVIVGDGPMAPRLTELIAARGLEARVCLFTDVDNDLLRLFYNAADVFVAPNIRVPGDMEGFGIVLLEAGACGLPVVGTDIEGLSEVLEGFGRRVAEGDVQGFVRHILAASDGPSARDYVISNYSWDRVVDRHLDCIGRELS